MPIDPYTPDELRGILAESGLVEADADTVAAVVNASMAETERTLVDHFLSGIRGPVRPETLARARAQAERQTRRIYGDMVKTELTKIAKTLEAGIAEGLGPDTIARRLDQIKGLDPQRAARYEKHRAWLESLDISDEDVQRRSESFFQKELRDRRRVIARTEQNFATSESNQIVAEDRGQRYKVWVTSGDDRVSQMDIDNEAAGWIPIDKKFPSGHDVPPSHPRCRCSVTYRTDAPSDAAKQRARARSERTRAAQEAAQQEEAVA